MPNVEATFIGEEESSNRSQDSGILDTEQCQRSVSRPATTQNPTREQEYY